MVDSCVHDLCCLVKSWAKQAGLVGTPDGVLSSYTYALMVILFMQRCHNLPNLQTAGSVFLVEGKLKTYTITKDGKSYNASFVSACRQPRGPGSCSELLHNFFKFWTEFHFNDSAVSVAVGKEFRWPDGNITGMWLIEDPFELDQSDSFVDVVSK